MQSGMPLAVGLLQGLKIFYGKCGAHHNHLAHRSCYAHVTDYFS